MAICRPCLILRGLALSLWLGALLFFSIQEQDALQLPPFKLWDKLQHALGYGLAAFLALRFWTLFQQEVKKGCRQVLVCISAYSGLVELMQAGLTRTRHAEFSDLVANVFGICVTCLLYLAAARFRLSDRRTEAGGE